MIGGMRKEAESFRIVGAWNLPFRQNCFFENVVFGIVKRDMILGWLLALGASTHLDSHNWE